jgi:hypothetical protein
VAGHEAAAPPLIAVVLLTSATLPPAVAMLIAPVASAVGKLAPTAPPDASWIRK